MRVEMELLERAIETFAHGFCFTRSLTHPYVASRIGEIWVVRDAPRKRGDYRREEWIARGVAPDRIDQVARKHARGRFAVCAIHAAGESDLELRAGFKDLHYRLGFTEAVMVHELKGIPRFKAPVEIARVTSGDLAGRLNKAAGSRQVLPEHLVKDSPLRQYVALVGEKPVGWVRSIEVGRTTWCSNMYVDPEYRRRGIARAMMSKMLRDDRASGSTLGVLTASHAGVRLYPAVGYRQIGTLLLYTPRKS